MSPRTNHKKSTGKAEKLITLAAPGRPIRKVKSSQLQSEVNTLLKRSAWREILSLVAQLGEQRLTHNFISNAFFKALEATEQKQALLKETSSALALSPRDPALLSWQAHALRLNGRVDESIDVLRKAIKQARPDANLFNSLGSALKETGEFAEAQSWFDKAIKIKPDLAKAYWNQSDLVTDHLAAAQSIEKQLQRIQDEDPNKYLMHFSLYRHYEKLGDLEQAFGNLQRANQLKHNQLEYDSKEGNQLTNRILQRFASRAETVENNGGVNSDAEQEHICPIFVFGLPRSGTTLVEQILASHSEVYGGNELTFLNDASSMLQQQKRIAGDFPDWTNALGEKDWRSIGGNYLRLLSTLGSDKPHITDKSLLNFRAAGLISRALPKAKMVHVLRDPMDLAFGCYRQNFGTGLLFSYDFENIAEMILDHQKLALHWQKTLPSSQYCLLDYQKLVQNPKAEIAQLLSFCALRDEAACYTPEQTQRTVRTLSATQVRQPINTSGLGSWKRYESQLQPLKMALEKRGLI